MDKTVAQQAVLILEKLLEVTKKMAGINLESEDPKAAQDIMDYIGERQSLLDSLEHLKQSEGGSASLHSAKAEALIAKILSFDKDISGKLNLQQQQVIEQISRVVSERKQLQRQQEAVIFEPGTLLDIKK